MIGPITIRQAIEAEQRALESLQLRASLNNEHDREHVLANPDSIHLPVEQITAGRVFVAESDGAIVGFAVMLSRTGGGGELDGLFVEPQSWRRGIGRTLVDYVGGIARSEGATTLHVIGNPHAKDFYRTCGFVVEGNCQTRFGRGLTMRKTLA